MRRTIALLLLLLALLTVVLPLVAQDAPPPLVTNTPPAPPPAPPAFATNTPIPTTQPIFTPDAPFEQYALRRWDEGTLVGLLLDQVRRLQTPDAERALAIRLLQEELARRFPAAPRDPTTRESLLQAMLAAPRGLLDLRPVVRPYIESALNQLRPAFDQSITLEIDGFALTIYPANVDGQGAGDAILRTAYPVGALDTRDLLYQDYTMAVVATDGTIRLAAATPSFPVAPLDAFDTLSLEGVRDINGDGLDEMAVSRGQSGQPNADLFIYGWRGGSAISLTAPGQVMRFNGLLTWPLAGSPLTLTEYRLESAAWGCLAERPVAWTWTNNFFRPPETTADFVPQNRLGCQMLAAEPILSQPPAEALALIERSLPLAGVEDTVAAARGVLLQAVLRVFNGDISGGLTQVNQLAEMAQPDTWLAQQAAAFQSAAREPNSTPLSLCAALQRASVHGACAVDDVLERLLTEQPLRRDEPIEAQAARLGLSVLDRVTISDLGRLDRQAVHFDLSAPDVWWAFAPLAEDVYTAERIAPPPGFQPLPSPILRIDTPPAALDALLITGDPAQALAILGSAVRANPAAPVASSGRYLQAVSYEALGDRDNARRAFFDLWREDPGSVWGLLAAVHLEKR